MRHFGEPLSIHAVDREEIAVVTVEVTTGKSQNMSFRGKTR